MAKPWKSSPGILRRLRHLRFVSQQRVSGFLLRHSLEYRSLERYKKDAEEYLRTNDRVLSMKRTRLTPCYDSHWEVEILLGGEVVKRNLVRHDWETALSLGYCLMQVGTPAELAALNCNIYYD